MMLKTLIVEDEHYIRKGLIAQIEDLAMDLMIVGECDSVEQAIIVAKATNPDLVFLDVNINGGTSFDFLEEVKELNFKIIFITAYEEYALKALKNNAVDYILKPVDQEELEAAIVKVQNLLCASKESKNKNRTEFNSDKKQLILSLHEGYQVVKFDELMYCKSDSGYTTFFMQNKSQHISSKPLKEYENLLPCYFLRTHQSYIVNLNFVDKLDKENYIIFKDKTKIPVSIRRKNEFLNRMLE